MYQHLTKVLNTEELDLLIYETYNERQRLSYTIAERHNKKMRALLMQRDRHVTQVEQGRDMNTTGGNTTKFNNFTEYDPTADELSLLNLGHKYAITTCTKRDVETLAVEMDAAIVGNEHETIIRCELSTNLKRSQNNLMRKSHSINTVGRQQMKTLKDLKEKINSLGIVCTLADKGAGLTFINKTEYNEKTMNFLTENNCISLNKNPINIYIKTLKQAIQKHKNWLNDNDCRIRRIIPMNPDTPNMYCQPKIHKANRPMRPIISAYNTPASGLGRFMACFLRNVFRPANNYTIKNSTELIDSIRNSSFDERHIMVSFDVTNLYASVPITSTMQILHKHLTDNDFDLNTIKSILELVEVVLQQNFFIFDDRIYKMTDGLPMGSPISAILAEIHMNYIENIIHTNTTYKDGIAIWKRYVDDIFAIWDKTISLDDFLEYINNISTSIKFTTEIQDENEQLNFLNLTLTKHNDTIKHKIYRKPTSRNIIIPFRSNHSMAHKISSFRYHLENIYTLKLDENQQKEELDVIYSMASEYGFPRKIIDNLHSKIKLKRHPLYTPPPDTNKKKTYRKFTYNNWIPNNILKTLHSHGITTAFTTQNKIINILKNTKRKKDTLEKSGIYSLKCQDCNAIYVGETGRNLRIRYNEHMKDMNSKIYRHVKVNKHEMPLENLTLERSMEKNNCITIYENLYIDEKKEDDRLLCLNGQTEISYVPIYKHLKSATTTIVPNQDERIPPPLGTPTTIIAQSEA